ncbi:MAG: Gfo/Idh/MocA family oxidoreductase [Acidobacteriota bacterium]|nr:Gfo/Idh/MocA family oxidoreductase [Acidobacteriota bacterium]
MNLAIVGCGFVADYYLATLPLHPELRLMGVMDRDASRAKHLAGLSGVRHYPELIDVLNDSSVELVLNLTNPRNHYEVSKAALLMGKHVYSEKPLGMQFEQAAELVELAESRGLSIASAPCSFLGETAQTMWKVLREQALGKVRVVYAEIDDGMVFRMPFRKWKSVSGIPWPYKDEFEVGCTLEHAGYSLGWLAAWFGPATTVTSFASVQVPDKLADETLDMDSPDFSVACIQFQSGVVARLTCGIIAPHDHSIKIFCDGGVLYTDESWDYRSPVYSRRMMTIRRKTFLNPLRKKHRLPRAPFGKPKTKGAQSMDFARGPAELAEAVRNNRPSRVSARFSLHINELALAIHWSREQGATYRMTTVFDPVQPMPWAD